MVMVMEPATALCESQHYVNNVYIATFTMLPVDAVCYATNSEEEPTQ